MSAKDDTKGKKDLRDQKSYFGRTKVSKVSNEPEGQKVAKTTKIPKITKTSKGEAAAKGKSRKNYDGEGSNSNWFPVLRQLYNDFQKYTTDTKWLSSRLDFLNDFPRIQHMNPDLLGVAIFHIKEYPDSIENLNAPLNLIDLNTSFYKRLYPTKVKILKSKRKVENKMNILSDLARYIVFIEGLPINKLSI